MPSLTRVRALPWLVLFELARTVQAHLGENLTASDRRRVGQIVKRTKGDPRKLTPKDKAELKVIANHLDIKRLGRDLVPTVARARTGRRR